MAAEIPEPDRFAPINAPQALTSACRTMLWSSIASISTPPPSANLMAALEAFQQAFPYPSCFPARSFSHNHLSKRVALLIKTSPRNVSPEWNWLQLRAQEDPRIHLLEAHLDRNVACMFGCCDAFLSHIVLRASVAAWQKRCNSALT